MGHMNDISRLQHNISVTGGHPICTRVFNEKEDQMEEEEKTDGPEGEYKDEQEEEEPGAEAEQDAMEMGEDKNDESNAFLGNILLVA